MIDSAQATARHWRGELYLKFARVDEVTRVVSSRVRMPLALQRSFYPEGPAVCHAVVLHPPGGMVSGDALIVDADFSAGCHALLTTPSAAKWYRSDGAHASQTVTLRVQAHATAEWLPQETIVFDGAQLRQRLSVRLAKDAHWIGWDVTRFGRSHGGETFTHGHWRSEIEVWREDGTPLWIDRQRLTGGSRLLQGAYGLGGHAVVGTFVWIGQAVEAGWVDAARACWPTVGDNGEVGVTRLACGVLCRYRGASSAAARAWFTAVWDLARRSGCGRPAHPPRIWNT